MGEVAEACGHGIEVDASAVKVLPETEVVCRVLDIDPWGLIASGSLLVMVRPEAESDLLQGLETSQDSTRRSSAAFPPGRVLLCARSPLSHRCVHLPVTKSPGFSSKCRTEGASNCLRVAARQSII